MFQPLKGVKVRGLEDVLAEDQVRARQLTHQIQVDDCDRPVHIPKMSFKADGANNATQTPPALLGADTDKVLGSVGISPKQIKALRSAGVI